MRGLEEEAVTDGLRFPVVDAVAPCSLLAAPVSHFIDFHTVTSEQLQRIQIPFCFAPTRPGLVDALTCWFDVSFDSSDPTV